MQPDQIRTRFVARYRRGLVVAGLTCPAVIGWGATVARSRSTLAIFVAVVVAVFVATLLTALRAIRRAAAAKSGGQMLNLHRIDLRRRLLVLRVAPSLTPILAAVAAGATWVGRRELGAVGFGGVAFVVVLPGLWLFSSRRQIAEIQGELEQAV